MDDDQYLHIYLFISDVHSPLPKRKNTDSFFGRRSHLFRDAEGQEDVRVNDGMLEMKAYGKLRCIDPDDDPLLFWKVGHLFECV